MPVRLGHPIGAEEGVGLPVGGWLALGPSIWPSVATWATRTLSGAVSIAIPRALTAHADSRSSTLESSSPVHDAVLAWLTGMSTRPKASRTASNPCRIGSTSARSTARTARPHALRW
ncbi:hypothetical protein [Halobellus salinus]|uniref:hypothetical protein n=1 Tax=Halobellus salinus TaxID=931585 RepID=UPI00166E22AD|nr:hypothetical protein [Halobellus salinus]